MRTRIYAAPAIKGLEKNISALWRLKMPGSLAHLFSLTWSCGSRQRDTASSGWKWLGRLTHLLCDVIRVLFTHYISDCCLFVDSFMDPNARRKNATRESTNTLKAWLNEHRKNPYPTKGEKIMLAIITKMTLTQVSTWFANARRRLKKENKMTWSPRNRCGEDGEDDDEDGDVGRRGSDADSLPGEGHRDRDDDEDELLDVDSDMVDVDCDVTDIPLTSAGERLIIYLLLFHFMFFITFQVNTRRSPNVGLMLGQRRRRSPNIEPTLGQGQDIVKSYIYI